MSVVTKRQKIQPLEYPESWDDDVRMEVRFAPFRPKDVNPENYIAKLNFWKTMIGKYCEHKGSADFSKSELDNALIRKGRRPHCLETVIEDMVISKEIRLKSDFLSDPLNTWSRWTVGLIKKSFSWAASKVIGNKPEDSEFVYVHLDVLKKQAEELHTMLQCHSGKLMTLDNVIELAETKLSRNGVLLIVEYLKAAGKLILSDKVEEESNEVLVKVPAQNEKVPNLSEVDLSIYHLEKSIGSMSISVEEMETELKGLDEKIRINIREGKREIAKATLRKKHVLKTKLDKKIDTLNNLQTLLNNVEDAQNNSAILEAYKYGSNALKKLLSDTGLKLDNVDEVVSNVKESIDTQNEIQEALAMINQDDTAENKSLEEELNEMLAFDAKITNNKKNVAMDLYEEQKQLLKQLEELEFEEGELDDSLSPAKDKILV